MGNVLPNLVHIETLVGCTVKCGECLGQLVGERRFGLLVHQHCCCNSNKGQCHTGACNTPVDVGMESYAVGRNEFAERQETAGNCDDGQEYQGESHRERCLVGFVRSFVDVRFVVALAPEYHIVESEHVESRHHGDAAHHCTHKRTEIVASYQYLVL